MNQNAANVAPNESQKDSTETCWLTRQWNCFSCCTTSKGCSIKYQRTNRNDWHQTTLMNDHLVQQQYLELFGATLRSIEILLLSRIPGACVSPVTLLSPFSSGLFLFRWLYRSKVSISDWSISQRVFLTFSLDLHDIVECKKPSRLQNSSTSS